MRKLAPATAWSRLEEKKLRALYPRATWDELERVFRRSHKAIRSKAKVLSIRRGEPRWHPTPAEKQILRERYPAALTRELAQLFGRSVCSTYQQAHALGLRKSREFVLRTNRALGKQLNEHGFAHRFPKGHVPQNKGTRRPGFAAGRMRETQFKKGQRSANWVPIGSIRRVDGYLYVKVDDTPEPPGRKGGQSLNWKILHHKLWTDAGNPPINTRTHVLRFKDGNRENCVLSNLELITRKQNRTRNSIHTLLPPDLESAVMALGALKRQLRRKDEQRGDGRSAHGAPGDAA